MQACHHPLAPGSAPPHYLAWNHEELRQLLISYPAVALVLQGHYHPGGAAEEGGLHFMTLEGMVEAPEGETAYAVADLAPGQITIQGGGACTSRVVPLRPM